MQSSPPTFGTQARLGDVMGEIIEHNVVLVKNGDKLAGIVSKIDLLDFMYG
jgi:predicted transcriptional regulator